MKRIGRKNRSAYNILNTFYLVEHPQRESSSVRCKYPTSWREFVGTRSEPRPNIEITSRIFTEQELIVTRVSCYSRYRSFD